MKLTIVRGLPGAGKSYFSKHNYNCLILENDMFSYVDGKYRWTSDSVNRAIALVRQITEMTLSNGSDVCVCNTFTKKKYVEAYRKIAEAFGADFKVYRCVGKFVNVHNVPENTLKSMKDNFEDWPGEEIINPEVSNCI